MSSDMSRETSMSREEAWDLIPWYVKGTLDAEEMAAVEARLAQDSELRAEVATQRRLAEGIGSLDDFSSGLERSLAATRERIEAESQQHKRELKPAALSGGLHQFWHQIGRSLRFDLRFVLPVGVLAAAVALFLVLPSLQPTEQGEFRTLTNPAVVSEAAQLRVKVAEDVTELQLRTLFMKHELQVIDGPSPTGVYTLETAPGGDPEEIAAALLAAPEIEFATVRGTP